MVPLRPTSIIAEAVIKVIDAHVIAASQNRKNLGLIHLLIEVKSRRQRTCSFENLLKADRINRTVKTDRLGYSIVLKSSLVRFLRYKMVRLSDGKMLGNKG